MESIQSNGSSSSTLELLAKYNDHRSRKDKAFEHIEKTTVNENGNNENLTYDELLKENVRLKLQNRELQDEVEVLYKIVDSLKSGNSTPHQGTTLSQIIEKHDEEERQDQKLVLPPRSADRNKYGKNLRLPTNEPSSTTETSAIDVPGENSNNDNGNSNKIDRPMEGAEKDTPLLPPVPQGNNDGNGSPAASTTYTSSRITVSHPSSPRRPLAENRIRSPQSANRSATVINNQLHSPMASAFGGETSINLKMGPESLPSPPTEMEEKFGLVDKPTTLDNVKLQPPNEFSPASKQNLNNFADYLDDTFKDDAESIDTITEKTIPDNGSSAGDNMPLHAPPPVPSPQQIDLPNQPLSAAQLGSPVLLNRKDQSKKPRDIKSPLKPTFTNSRSRDNLNDGSIPGRTSTESLSTKSASTVASNAGSHTDTASKTKRPHAESISTVESTAASTVSDIPLFVQPDEFDTIRMEVLSSLFFETETFDHPQILFSVIDRKSNKDIFKFAKTFRKLCELDNYLRQRLPSSTLPPLPDRQAFDTLVPSKVDGGRERLNYYFTTLFRVLELAPILNLKVAQFMSTDMVMNPVIVGDTTKEGSLLMRKAKALGNATNWRIRYGVLRGEFLKLFDKGQLAETINLKQSSIELLPNLPEDRYGTKNGFLLTEHKKSGLSSTAKYYLCSETSKERESWVAAVSEYVLSPSPAQAPSSLSAPSVTSLNTFGDDAASSSHKSDTSVDQIYVTDLTEPPSIPQNNDSSSASSPRITSESSEDDKDSRRLKMRSFFPFKKLTSGAFSLGSDATETETVNSQESEPKYSDNSIAKSLESMNLTESTAVTAVFGSPLDRCLQLSSHSYQGKYDIPSVVYRCLEYLYKNRGIQEEGIFRLSGSSALIKSLQEQFDREYDIDLCNYNHKVANDGSNTNQPGYYVDVNTVSGLLKLYLRKLPHVIFGEEQYPMFKKAADDHHDNPAQIALEFKNIVKGSSVPQPNISLMYALFELLIRINENSRANKMNLRNLCIVFSPTLNIPVTVLQPFITDFSCIFQDGQPVDQQKREKIDLHIPGM
ncbi:hypothetical protein ZYGR_0AS04630 [Zygosaccharomyces rouxii]|uniref:GTPase-activating protein BEM3 n=1 Tax=Zygosaccharomyces rouxii TaxID=4956 RepID=A0A1Q3AHB5_ZYGRO|nr:hypothetical protein ZYGR_0AS04630 [Zygosaccharomyces rouxii]